MTATTTRTDATLALIKRFESKFSSPTDVDGLMSEMTEDCVFEHVAPQETSFGRYEGQEAVRGVWESLESHFPRCTLTLDDVFAHEDRGAARWTMRWHNPDGSNGFARGVDVYTVRDGKIAVKLTYATL
jgi:ketosteroid isomerase-like protein